MAIYSTDLTYCDMSFKTHSIGIHDVLKALSHRCPVVSLQSRFATRSFRYTVKYENVIISRS